MARYLPKFVPVLRESKQPTLDYNSLLHLLRHLSATGPFDLAFNSADIQSTLLSQGELTDDQQLFHPQYGIVVITAIDGPNIIVREENDPAAIHQFKSNEILTESQARFGLRTTSFAGGHKAWRYRQAKWAWLVKLFCTKRGDWKDVLDECGLHRSSMDDLVRWYDNEVRYKAQKAQALAKFPESGNNPPPETTSSPETSNDSLSITRPQNRERAPDLENDNRQENIKREIEKRAGVVPTYHATTLYLQRRNLSPGKLGLYNKIKEADERRIRELEQQKMDELIEQVLALAPDLLPASADVPVLTEKRSESATSVNDSACPTLTAADAEIASDVRSGLRSAGVKAAAINKIQFINGLDFNEQYVHALKQLKTNA